MVIKFSGDKHMHAGTGSMSDKLMLFVLLFAALGIEVCPEQRCLHAISQSPLDSSSHP